MIAGIGIDMIEVERVSDKVTRDRSFTARVFSSNEIAYCDSKADKFQHFAARFAAKEAFLKATGKGLLTGFDLHHIEVATNDDGRPEILLSGIYLEMQQQHGWSKIHVSLSHLKTMACAVVIIEI